MMIKELFVKPIDRPINGVIKADQLRRRLRLAGAGRVRHHQGGRPVPAQFFEATWRPWTTRSDPTVTARMGVWVSGFFGSGKSHFIKILSYLLNNLEAHATPARRAAAGRRVLRVARSRTPCCSATSSARSPARPTSSCSTSTARPMPGPAATPSCRSSSGSSTRCRACRGDCPHIAHMERHLDRQGQLRRRSRRPSRRPTATSGMPSATPYEFLRDDVIAGLSEALGDATESAGKWIDGAAGRLSHHHRKLRQVVREYLDAKGPEPPHRVPGRRGRASSSATTRS